MKMKRIISLFLCLILTFSALGLFTQNASAATRTGADKLTSYTTSSSKTYVLNAIDYYLGNNTSLQSAVVVFLFEGASKDPAEYAYGGTRNQAIAVVVSSGNIIYVEGNCSTIPDCPDKDYNDDNINTPPSSASVKDGVYKLVDKGDNFWVKNLDGSDGLPCIRLNKSTEEYINAKAGDEKHATWILVHGRSKDTATGESASIPRSSGCMLVGSDNPAFNTFRDTVRGISGTRYLVIDRHLAVKKLKSFVYGKYSKDGSKNAVEVMTANSANASSGGSGSGSSGGTDVTTSLPLLKQGGSQNTKLRVKTLQRMLIAKGYSCGSCGADGDFGSGTKSGVIKFQKAKGLTQDGIVGNATWTALLKACQIQKGAKGDLVKLLQQILISQGYSCGSCGADGDFGTATRNAVIQFQKAKGLSQDGIVGKDTWTRLLLAYFY